MNTEALILAVNTGSSSLKFALFVGSDGALEPLANGAVEGLGTGKSRAWISRNGQKKESTPYVADHAAALETALGLLKETGLPQPTMVGHRVVHGGPDRSEPVKIDDALIAELKKIVPMAPLHLPPAIGAMEAIADRLPEVPQVACFDTAFHATMPEVARRLPIPNRYDDRGVRRYGFHGLSFEYVMSKLGASAPARVVIAHLGSGSSVVAVENGKSIDTTMGFTPTGGVMMGTRTGDLDPGVILYLQRQEKLDVDKVEKLVEHDAGMRAIAGDSDMKTLLERSAGGDENAKLAIAMFAYSVRKAIGAMSAVLGGMDLLVFTGGIGEHAAPVREAAAKGFSCPIQVIATDEDFVVAQHTLRLAAMH